MADQILVFVNDRSVRIYRGMRVKHALISCDYALYKAAEEGSLFIEDEGGFRIGLEGALHDKSRIYTRSVASRA